MDRSVFASVAFLKIGDFSRRPPGEQARLRAQLDAVLAVTLAELAPRERIVLQASDGAAVVLLDDPAAALRLAGRALGAAAAGLPLSAGLNHGPVQLDEGRSGDSMIGDGIAVAAAVAEFAPPARLFASRSFRTALERAAPGAEAVLVPAGTFTDRSLRAHELFAPDDAAPARRARRYLALSAVAAIALVGVGVGSRVAAEGRDQFVRGLSAKYHNAATRGERAVRRWLRR